MQRVKFHDDNKPEIAVQTRVLGVLKPLADAAHFPRPRATALGANMDGDTVFSVKHETLSR